jgi:hypothetical protein
MASASIFEWYDFDCANRGTEDDLHYMRFRGNARPTEKENLELEKRLRRGSLLPNRLDRIDRKAPHGADELVSTAPND